MDPIDSSKMALAVAWYVIFVFSTVMHEAAHALAAKLGGDETAARGGQVSLDPLPHIRREPFGMVLVPLASFMLMGFTMGWASTPYDPRWADDYPHRAGRMAAAGPLANLLLVFVSGALIRLGLHLGWMAEPSYATFSALAAPRGDGMGALILMLSVAFSLNLLLFVFNVLPFPPLDGAGIVGLFMPESAARRWHRMVGRPGASFVTLLIAWVVIGRLFGPIWNFAVDLLYHRVHL